MKAIRIILFILIIIGIGLLCTQKYWVPQLVNKILEYQGVLATSQILSSTITVSSSDKQKTIFCEETPNYFVVSSSNSDSVGTNILVKYKTEKNQIIPCAYTVAAGDFEIKNADADYFYAITNKFLVIDRGTAPFPRTFLVYNLETRGKLTEFQYSAPVLVGDNSITYWNPVKTAVTKENCPQLSEYTSGGLSAGIETHVTLNLSDFTKKDLGESRCSARQ